MCRFICQLFLLEFIRCVLTHVFLISTGSDITYGSTQPFYFDGFVSQETKEGTESRIQRVVSAMAEEADLGLILLPEPDNTGHGLVRSDSHSLLYIGTSLFSCY